MSAKPGVRRNRFLVVYATIGGVCLLLTFIGCAGMHATWERLAFWRWPEFGRAPFPQNLERFSRSVRPIREDAAAHYRLGRYYQDRGQHRLAIAEFREVLQVDATNAKSWNAIGVSHDRLGEYVLAQEAYREALKVDPDLGYVHNNLGYSHLLEGDYPKADAEIRQALTIGGENPVARNNLALLQEKIREAAQPPETASSPAAPDSQPSAVPPTPAGVLQPIDREKPTPLKKAEMEEEYFLVPVKTAGAKGIIMRRMTLARAQQENVVEIANGSGSGRILPTVEGYLKNKGYRVILASKPTGKSVGKTLIYYREGALQPAYRVAKEIPGHQNMKKVKGFNGEETTVRILLGQDLLPQMKVFASEQGG